MFQSVVKIAINTTNKDLIEEGKKILSLIKLSDDTFEELKELASNGNKDAEDLLKKSKFSRTKYDK